jgi:LysR family hydrogen peroxide-inducible transcriptional activator
VERRQGDAALTALGTEVAQRAERVVSAARDLVDFAQHRGRVLTGRLQLGVIPTLAPYVLPRILPVLQARYPDLRIELRETQTKALLDELARGTLDVVMLALPAADPDVETLRLFDDQFLLAVPATDKRSENRARARGDD